MARVRKIGKGGRFEFEFTIQGLFGRGETRQEREVRFEAELQTCCATNPDFAAYVQKYHIGYGKGIHLGRCS